jgi:hypothetical protein
MSIDYENDIVRGLGFVTLYAGYLEEQIDNLLFMLQPLEAYLNSEQRWPIQRKVKKARRLIGQIQFETQSDVLNDLGQILQLFERRNEVIHGRIYANFDRPDTLKSGRPNVPDRKVTAIELYELAKDLDAARLALHRPMIIKIPKALSAK